MTGTLKVSPDVLKSTATAFNSSNQQIKNTTGQMMQLITSTCAKWEGEASRAYLNKFKGLEDDIQRMYNLIREHVEDLQQMANEYTQAENADIQLINSLDDNPIEG